MELLSLGLSGFNGTFYFKEGEEMKKLNISSQGVSQPVTYSGPYELLLYASPEHLQSTKALPPVAKIALKPQADRQLLVFSQKNSAEENERKIQIVPLGIATTEFTNGDYKVFNFCQFPIKIKIGNRAEGIGAGKEIVLKKNRKSRPHSRLLRGSQYH